MYRPRPNTINSVVDYLVEKGVEEHEVDHLLRERIFAKKAILDFIREGEWGRVWEAASSYVGGLAFDPNSAIALGVENFWD